MFTLKAINNNSIKTTDLLGTEVFFTPFERDWLNEDLSGFAENTNLTEAYPKVVSCKLRKEDQKTLGDCFGYFQRGNNKQLIVYSNRTEEQNMSIIVHEVQHLLQYLDDRNGGSNDELAIKLATKFIKEASVDTEDLDFISRQSLYLDHKDQKEVSKERKRKAQLVRSLDISSRCGVIYTANVGEIEARAAQLQLLVFPGWSEIKRLGLVRWSEEYLNDNKSWHTSEFKESGKTRLSKSVEELKIIVKEKKMLWMKEYVEAQSRVKDIPEVSEDSSSLEEHYWKVLGDAYRDPMTKPRSKKVKESLNVL